jgi:murein DD-endopeptidase MepM/ murein hydrolase activator NlpD
MNSKKTFAIYFFILLLFTNFIELNKLEAVNYNSKINNNLKELKKIDDKLSKYNSKLSRIGRDIVQYQREVQKINGELYQIEKELRKKELSYKQTVERLDNLKKTEQNLVRTQKLIQNKIIKTIAKIVSISFVITSSTSISHNTQESIITEEFLLALQKKQKIEMKKLDLELKDSREKRFVLSKNMNELKKVIQDVENQRANVLKKKNQKSDLLKKSKISEKEYKNQLNANIEKQNNLKKVIADLKAEQEKFHRNNSNQKVKNYASNYRVAKTTKYRGQKTIAPLKHYTIAKKYGPYVDPIYNIKVFNEHVTLRSKYQGANVFNVFNGKVTLVKKHVLLNNIVVIEHYNGLQTVYAYLEKVSPAIAVGKKIKKGTVVGRINNDLMFEVMNKNHHINPIEIIAKSQ